MKLSPNLFYSVSLVQKECESLKYGYQKLKKQDECDNVFPYVMAPSSDTSNYEKFMEQLSFMIEEYKSENPEEANLYKNPETIVAPNIKEIVCVIQYPIQNIIPFVFECKVPVTWGLTLYAFTVAYQTMYKLEDEDVGHATGNIPGMFNRASSAGRFGIWGHCIEDLTYNGSIQYVIYNDKLFVDFGCDS